MRISGGAVSITVHSVTPESLASALSAMREGGAAYIVIEVSELGKRIPKSFALTRAEAEALGGEALGDLITQQYKYYPPQITEVRMLAYSARTDVCEADAPRG